MANHKHQPKLASSFASSYAGDEAPSHSGGGGGSHSSSTGRKHHHHRHKNQVAASRVKVAMSYKIKAALGVSLTAIVICFAVAFLTLKKEDVEFRQTFSQDAEKLLAHVGRQGEKNLQAMSSLGTFVTSYSSSALANSIRTTGFRGTWPFVTVENFDAQASNTLSIMNTSRVFLSPSVTKFNRPEWEVYSNTNQGWSDYRISPKIFKVESVDEEGNVTKTADNSPPFHPVWQMEPPNSLDIKFNMVSIPSIAKAVEDVFLTQSATMTLPLPGNEEEQLIVQNIDFFSVAGQEAGEPVSILLLPVFDTFQPQDRAVVGVLMAPFLWKSYVANALGADARGVMVVLSCGPYTYSYQLDRDNHVRFLGEGDLHHPYYTDAVQSATFANLLDQAGFTETSDSVAFRDGAFSNTTRQYQLSIYPTAVYENSVTAKWSVKATVFVVVVSACLFLSFLFVGGKAEEQFSEMKKKAEESANIVDTLFPKDIQERLFRGIGNYSNSDRHIQTRALLNTDDDPLSKLKDILNDTAPDKSTDAVADLWPNCTVLFADIVGFTSWAGCREPKMVFTLLEAIFNAFDACGKRRGIFKVETVGDCYVAVTGLPVPRNDHALVMSRFAGDCITMMTRTTNELEPQLGPDTGDLKIRIGLNSGPVTAGVLRGEKGRFQLFGDTVNTAARIESSGRPNCVHVSESTAELLKQHGKDNWITPREHLVEAKGKGLLKTYWVEPRSSVKIEGRSCDKTARLVEWNVQVFAKLLQAIVARRGARRYHDFDQSSNSNTTTTMATSSSSSEQFRLGTKPRYQQKQTAGLSLIDEVMDILDVGEPQAEVAPVRKNEALDPHVMAQLREFIRRIALLYQSNSFHNFEHASHVTMNATKMLSRISAPNTPDAPLSDINDTYGLADNPLTHLAVCFGALIHDADHPGVTNTQLVLEGSALALKYKNKSVAEQHSLAICLDLLYDEKFDDLRWTICPTRKESNQFRQLVVNTVMATDIMDKDLKTLRNARWEKAFQDDPSEIKANRGITIEIDTARKLEKRNAKATIIIEHLIQASDVSHTMQHWHVFRKWNENLFFEMHKAYREGRATTDPSISWYRGEIGFFDFYIIPLAKKLSQCGVFGVSSDEFLHFALANRIEWEQKGEAIVAEMVGKLPKVGHS